MPLMLACVTGNSLTLSAILRTPSLRSPSNIFMCSLAISDLLVGIIVQPVYIAYELKQEPPLTFAINMLFSFTGVVSLCTMTAISVDRFMALQFHLRYQCLMTEKRAMYTSLSLWLFGILSSFVTLWNKTIMFAFLAVGIAICILFLRFRIPGFISSFVSISFKFVPNNRLCSFPWTWFGLREVPSAPLFTTSVWFSAILQCSVLCRSSLFVQVLAVWWCGKSEILLFLWILL